MRSARSGVKRLYDNAAAEALNSLYKKELIGGRDGGPRPQSASKVAEMVHPDQPVCRLANPASRNSGVYNPFFGYVTPAIVRIVPRADVLGVVVIKPGVEKRIRLLVT